MNLALCLIVLQLCFIISNTESVKKSVKNYVTYSISDVLNLKNLKTLTFLRFHHNHNQTNVYKIPNSGQNEQFSLKIEKHVIRAEKDILNGKVLRVTKVEIPGAKYFLHEVCKALELVGNFTIEYVTDSVFSGFLEETSKTRHGELDLRVDNQVNIASFSYLPNPRHLKAFDFSVAIMSTSFTLSIRKPLNKVRLLQSKYFQAFELQAWCGMVLLLITSLALLTFMKKKVVKKLNYVRFISKHTLQLLGIICQQGLSEFPRSSSHAMVYYAIFLFAIFVYSIYSAELVCYLVNIDDNLPFTSFEEFAQNKLYKLIVPRNSTIYKLIQMNDDYPWNIMKNKLMKNKDLPITVDQYWDMICSENVAGLNDELIYGQSKENYKCSVALIYSKQRNDLSFAFQKNSIYKRALNYNILKLKNYGILDRIYKSTFDIITKLSSNEDAEIIYAGVTVLDITSLLAILLGSVVLSLIVLFFEKFQVRFYGKDVKKTTVAIAVRPAVAPIKNMYSLRTEELFNDSRKFKNATTRTRPNYYWVDSKQQFRVN